MSEIQIKNTEAQTKNLLIESFSAAKFTFFHANSRKFTNFHQIFFLPVWTANNAKIVSHGLFHKKSFMFPKRGGNMVCFKYRRFFVKRPMRGYFSVVRRGYFSVLYQ
jgi:hypothetical protein